MAAEEQKLAEDQRELVAIGASIGAGCQPCVSYHLGAAAKAGLSAERLLGAVINAECAGVDSAERMEAHVRAHLGTDIREPQVTSALDEALAVLGGALGANDLANVERQLQACQQLGVSRSQLREAIELCRAVQENATRMHFRAALDFLADATARGEQTENAGSRPESAGDGASVGDSNFVSMMADFLALMDSCDDADLREKMAQCFSIFESSGCCQASRAATGEQQPATACTPMSSSSCDCAGMR